MNNLNDKMNEWLQARDKKIEWERESIKEREKYTDNKISLYQTNVSI